MRVYFIAHTDDNGESDDWFATANDPEEAVRLWRSRWEAVNDAETSEPRFVFDITEAFKVTDARLLNWHGSNVRRVGGTAKLI